VFVLPSSSEGLSNSLLEALAASCLVIASNIPAHREVIEHGVTGLLFDNGDQLANYLDEVLSDFSLYDDLRVRAFALAEKNFRIESIVDRLARFYHSMVSP
jgi:glycosyltransferase involved in cell wall biosynthesis